MGTNNWVLRFNHSLEKVRQGSAHVHKSFCVCNSPFLSFFHSSFFSSSLISLLCTTITASLYFVRIALLIDILFAFCITNSATLAKPLMFMTRFSRLVRLQIPYWLVGFPALNFQSQNSAYMSCPFPDHSYLMIQRIPFLHLLPGLSLKMLQTDYRTTLLNLCSEMIGFDHPTQKKRSWIVILTCFLLTSFLGF